MFTLDKNKSRIAIRALLLQGIEDLGATKKLGCKVMVQTPKVSGLRKNHQKFSQRALQIVPRKLMDLSSLTPGLQDFTTILGHVCQLHTLNLAKIQACAVRVDDNASIRSSS